MTRLSVLAAVALCAATTSAATVIGATAAHAQQPIDSAYTRAIQELTPTDPKWKFSTELVDYLPASATVPSPLKVLGYVPGTVGKLSHVADINRYFRALAAASPRVKVYSAGLSDEGREMLAVAISDEQTIASIDQFKQTMARLSDTRTLSADERTRLLGEAKPVYWLTGSIHSPETGSPEMLMELAYRLAVDESPHVKAIRAGVITLITPVLEVDGRDRMVDVMQESRALKVGDRGVPLVYWGKYTAHDNNRDAMVLSQKLTQNVMKIFLEWHPIVAHDLHESVPFLYTSTGTGPYNDEFDPILTDELHTLAYQEITELTRRGLPGVWTHGFYDGWAPNYTILSVASLHNSIGRFYETYTSLGAGCHQVHLGSDEIDRRWDRENPPVNGVRWCIRTNINYQESGVLIALRYVADHRPTFMANYLAKVDRIIRPGPDVGAVRLRDPARAAPRGRSGGARQPVPRAGCGDPRGVRRLHGEGSAAAGGIRQQPRAARFIGAPRGDRSQAAAVDSAKTNRGASRRLDRAHGPAVHGDGAHTAGAAEVRRERADTVRRHRVDARPAPSRDRGARG